MLGSHSPLVVRQRDRLRQRGMVQNRQQWMREARPRPNRRQPPATARVATQSAGVRRGLAFPSPPTLKSPSTTAVPLKAGAAAARGTWMHRRWGEGGTVGQAAGGGGGGGNARGRLGRPRRFPRSTIAPISGMEAQSLGWVARASGGQFKWRWGVRRPSSPLPDPTIECSPNWSQCRTWLANARHACWALGLVGAAWAIGDWSNWRAGPRSQRSMPHSLRKSQHSRVPHAAPPCSEPECLQAPSKIAHNSEDRSGGDREPGSAVSRARAEAPLQKTPRSSRRLAPSRI